MKRPWRWVAAGAVCVAALFGGVESAAEPDAGVQAFGDIYRVLLSPRCRNCHPVGDAPLQGDAPARPHAMNVSRRSPGAGLPCISCHREVNAREPGGPPGVPGWRMPAADVPMVFEGRTPRELCLQLKDPAKTRGKDLAALREHMASDPLVLWGWSPGPGRTLPPLGHEETTKRMDTWIQAGAPCP